jgi:putative chitinase
MGNGNEASGEGFKFRGRGLIQLTGKANYAECGEQIGVDLVANPNLLRQPEYATKSAFWFWMNKGLNQFADKKDIKTITFRINGGLNGLNERTKYFERALLVLA